MERRPRPNIRLLHSSHVGHELYIDSFLAWGEGESAGERTSAVGGRIPLTFMATLSAPVAPRLSVAVSPIMCSPTESAELVKVSLVPISPSRWDLQTIELPHSALPLASVADAWKVISSPSMNSAPPAGERISAVGACSAPVRWDLRRCMPRQKNIRP